jgi:hypothetical protein
MRQHANKSLQRRTPPLNMTERFPPGSTAYTKDGRAYTVEEVAGGIAYCSLPNGTETDFPESQLLTAAEWSGQSGGQDDVLYGRIGRAKPYTAPAAKIDGSAAEKVVQRADKLSPGLIDFAAFTIAQRALTDSGHTVQSEGLSIIKCRKVFDERPPEVQLNALAFVLGADTKVLAGMANVGDNLIRAVLDQGLAPHAAAFEEFCDRPRR